MVKTLACLLLLLLLGATGLKLRKSNCTTQILCHGPSSVLGLRRGAKTFIPDKIAFSENVAKH
jgi:hypothetical protein